MSERFKYSLNGEYKCEQFAQLLATNDFPSVPLGSAGERNNWIIKMRSDAAKEIHPWMCPSIADTKHGVRLHFCVVKKDGSRTYIRTNSQCLERNEGPIGLYMDIMELLNVKNGYLDDGALVIEYGLQVEATLGMDNIWRFNTRDSLFDCQEKKNMITFPCYGNSYHHVHKQLFMFNSSYFNAICEKNKENFVQSNDLLVKYSLLGGLGSFLQIANGVQLKAKSYSNVLYYEVMHIAKIHRMPNVIHYCERQLIENKQKGSFTEWILYYDVLRHYLVHLMKNKKSPKDMIDERDIEKMKGQTLKIFIAKFLYNKF